MAINGAVDNSSPQHPFKGNQEAITRPDWVRKHDDEIRARNLLAYILKPSDYAEKVKRVSADAVIIEDKYPKAQVHLLVLPKWQPHRDMHPHDAFEDPDFLSMVRAEAAIGLQIAIGMLRAKMQRTLKKGGSKQTEVDSMLSRRDFTKDFQIGIHAHPSQHELHVHIISRDMLSSHEYSSRHYNAFNTPFLVPLKVYPLPTDDMRRETKFQNANLTRDLFQCWRCGKDYADDWKGMKEHLRKEWPLWVAEDPEEHTRGPDNPQAQAVEFGRLPTKDIDDTPVAI